MPKHEVRPQERSSEVTDPEIEVEIWERGNSLNVCPARVRQAVRWHAFKIGFCHCVGSAIPVAVCMEFYMLLCRQQTVKPVVESLSR